MKVSVLMPAYNHETFVGTAIESVLSQSFTDFEFLIGDDASTDRTAEIIRSYNDSRIRFYQHCNNFGATLNHRFLLEQAQGEYIALINSDDIWMSGRLQKQVEYLNKHPNTVMCSSWANFIDENGDSIAFADNIFEQPNRTQEEWIEYFFCHGNCICHPGVLVRNNIYKKIGYYNLALRQLPDFEIWVRMIREGDFYIFQEPLVAHRRFLKSGENTSTPKPENSIRDVMESYFVLTHYLNELDDVLFCKAFHRYFRDESASTHEELCCERFFLLQSGRYYMSGISKQAATMYIYQNYSLDMAGILRKKYQYTLTDIHALSCQVDLLGILHSTYDLRKANEEIATNYIRENQVKALGLALLQPNTRLYKFGKKIFHKIRNKK